MEASSMERSSVERSSMEASGEFMDIHNERLNGYCLISGIHGKDLALVRSRNFGSISSMNPWSEVWDNLHDHLPDYSAS